MNNFIKGFSYAFSGFSWILRPKIRRFVYIPLAINIVLFTIAIGVLANYAEAWVSDVIGQKSDWWTLFQWTYDFIVPILSFVIYGTLFFVSYFIFSTVANLIAAPFNSILAKAVEQRLAGQHINYTELPLSKEIWITLKSELTKTGRFILFACLMLCILLIPIINVIFPVAWFIFMAYALSLQYADFPMANHALFYKDQRKVLQNNRMQRLGFGVAASLMMLIPVVNFIAMPVCVCGATVWWHTSLNK